MKLHPRTPWIISVAAVVFGSFGLFMVLKIPHRTWFDWYVHIGGLILIGVLFGFCIGFLARYLWLPSLSSRSLGRRRTKSSANERLPLSIDTLPNAAKANLENTRSQLFQPFLFLGIV